MGTFMGNKQVVEFGVYEMEYKGNVAKLDVSESSISPISFDKNYYERYSGLINSCFYEMRRALNIQPYESYCADLEELVEQKRNCPVRIAWFCHYERNHCSRCQHQRRRRQLDV
jgi:hypothetical protein